MQSAHTKTLHGAFSVERIFDVPVEKVFQAFTNGDARKKWLIQSDGWSVHEVQSPKEFKAGAIEFSRFSPPGAQVELTNHTFFMEIDSNKSIIFSYYMTMDNQPLSSSLVHVVFERDDGKTHLKLTEHGIYHDGNIRGREEGTQGLLEVLVKFLENA